MEESLYNFLVIYDDGHTWGTVANNKEEVMEYLKNALRVDTSKISKIIKTGDNENGNI